MHRNRKKLKRRKKENGTGAGFFKRNLQFLLGIKRNKKGEGYVFVSVMVIAFAFLLAMVLKYFELSETVNENRRWVSEKLDAYMTLYSKENSMLLSGDFATADYLNENLDKSALVNGLYGKIGVNNKELLFMCAADGNVMMKNIEATVLTGNQIGISMKYELYVPVNFAGIDFGNMKVNMQVKSRLVNKG